MPEELREIYRDYQNGKISRRDFINKAVLVTGSLAAANSLISTLMPASSHAAQVPENDPEILTHNIQYPGKAGPVFAYLARPVKAGKYPGIVLIHENRGLDDHIRDVARRFAKEGYVALTPDFLSRQGGTMKVNPKGGGLPNIRELAPWQGVTEDADAGFKYLRVLPDVRADRMGVVGFCWGGGMAFVTATQQRDLKAAVVYYGPSPSPMELVKDIRAPILAHYGEKDPGVNKGIPETVEAMKKFNKVYEHRIYPGALHAFNNDTNPERYNAQAAKEAWGRTMDFFKKNLKG
ncbi:MAG TPA: dienelactone hydrolase family protein [Candidatus Binatia bacterium]|jgi:carboxymethylenebutenolidase